MAEALYRKYRPQIFEDVVGQERIERTIKNAIEQDKVSHAYLFTGPRGTGKTTTARLLAKALLCEKGPTPEPDGTCVDCAMIAAGEHPDVYELDAASRTGVENVREEIIGRVQFAPTRGRYKVYIIDEVHMLSTAAFNALLKTLEEPPDHVVFVLCTTDPQKVPETIHSRCQRFDFRRISVDSIVSRLGAICVSEGVEFEGEALDLIAHRAEGGMRNALTSLEQLIAFGEGRVTLEVAERLLGAIDTNDMVEIVTAIGKRDVAACFRWTAEYVETGADLAQFTRDLAEHIRNMYVLALAGADVALEISDATRRELVEEMAWFGPDRLARLLGVLGDLSAELKTSTNPRLSFEIALTRMVRPDSDLTLVSLAERVEALEQGYSSVAHVLSAPSSGMGPVGGASAGNRGIDDASITPMGTTQAPPAEPSPLTADAPQSQGVMQVPPAQDSPLAVEHDIVSARRDSGRKGEEGVSAYADPAALSASVSTDTASGRSVSSTSTAEPSPELVASLENPAALQRVWQGALSALKKNKAAYGVLFLNTKARYDKGRGLFVIEFPAENAFAFKAVQKPDVQDAVVAALVQACGTALPFIYTQGSDEGVASSGRSGDTVSVGGSSGISENFPVQKTTSNRSHAAQPGVRSAHQDPSSSSVEPIVSEDVPEPERVSLDTYDRPPYDDEVVFSGGPPSHGEESLSDPSLESRSESTAAGEPPSQQGSSTSDTSSMSDVSMPPSGDGTVSVKTPGELESMLTAGFGDGVIVREVRE